MLPTLRKRLPRLALALFPDVDRLLIHFDVDVIDFVDAPLSENTGRNEGLTLDQALRALRVFTAHPAFAALTITELNPLHGEEDGATLERFIDGLVEGVAVGPGDHSVMVLAKSLHSRRPTWGRFARGAPAIRPSACTDEPSPRHSIHRSR